MPVCRSGLAALVLTAVVTALLFGLYTAPIAPTRSRSSAVNRTEEGEDPNAWVTFNTTGRPIRVASLAQIARCLNQSRTKKKKTTIRFLSLGDSFGREMVEGLQLRFEPITPFKHADFDLDYDLEGTRVQLGQRFHSKVTVQGLNAALKAQLVDANTLVVVARGAADWLYFGSPLADFHAEIKALATALIRLKTRGVVWRLPHDMTTPSAWHNLECVPSVPVYRRVAACAVGEALETGNSSDPRGLTLFDPTELVAADITVGPDGSHIGGTYAAVLTDVVMTHAFCPDQAITPGAVQRRAFLSGSWQQISARYRCDDLKRIPAAQWESQLFSLGPRYGCRCSDVKRNLNDQCEISFIGFYPAVKSNNELPRHFRSYVCKLRALAATNVPTNLSHGLWAPSRDVQVSESWLEEIVMDLCVAPAAKMTLLQNLGYVPPLAVVDAYHGKPVGLCTAPDTRAQRQKTPWCRDRAVRTSWLTTDLNLLWDRVRNANSPRALPSIGRCGSRGTTTDKTLSEEFLHQALGVLCHPRWAPGVGINQTADALRARRSVFTNMKKFHRLDGPLLSRLGRAIRE